MRDALTRVARGRARVQNAAFEVNRGSSWKAIGARRDERMKVIPWAEDKAITEGFFGNPIVGGLCRQVATGGGSVPWFVARRTVGRDGNETWERDPKDPLSGILERPHRQISRQVWMYRWMLQLQLLGEGFGLLLPRPGGDRERDRTQSVERLWQLDPTRMDPKERRDAEGEVIHWEYTVERGDNPKYKPSEVIRPFVPHPTKVIQPAPPLQLAWKAVAQRNAAAAWNDESFRNGARVEGIFFDRRISSQPELETARVRLREATARRGRNYLLMPGGEVSFQQTSQSARDLDFATGQDSLAADIALALGHLMSMVSRDAQTYDNLRTATRWRWMEIILPLADLIRDALNLTLIPVQELSRRWITYDVSGVEALQEDIKEMVASHAKLVGQGRVSVDDSLQLHNLNVPQQIGGDRPWAPRTMAPVDEDAETDRTSL